jgi:hypothetical protein
MMGADESEEVMREASRFSHRGPLLFVALAMGILLVALAIVEALGDQARPGSQQPWVEYLESMDDALANGDARATDWALRQAHWAALGSRRWKGMIEVGDAARRIGKLTAARTAYLTAAFRARRIGSLEGVLSAAAGFAALGDGEVAGRWIAVARELAGRDPIALDSVNALIERLTTRTSAEFQP